MKDKTTTVEEYRTPKCKVVVLLAQSSILESSVPGSAGNDFNPVNDDEDY